MRDHPTDLITLTPMDYVRGALENALESGLTLDDVCRMAANADSPEAFDLAVNMLAQTLPVHNGAYAEFNYRMTKKAVRYLGDDAGQWEKWERAAHRTSVRIFAVICVMVMGAIYQAWVM